MFRTIIVFFSFLLVFISSCGDDDPVDNYMNVDGDWSGSWGFDIYNGDVSLTFEQNRNILRGTGQFNSNPCTTNVLLWGTIDEEGYTSILGLIEDEQEVAEREALDPSASIEELKALDDPPHILRMEGNFTDLGVLTLDFSLVKWEEGCVDINGVISVEQL